MCDLQCLGSSSFSFIRHTRKGRLHATPLNPLPLILAGLLLSPGWGLLAQPLDSWQWRSPLPQGNDLYGLACGNGLYVAVGSHGTLLTSTNGLDWDVHSLETNYTLNAVTYGDGLFVAVGGVSRYGYNGLLDDVILTSTDGLNWTQRPTGGTNGLNGVAWGNGRFVAVGSLPVAYADPQARIFTSTNGLAWTSCAPATNTAVLAVTWGQGTFVAVGSACMQYSDDGLLWQAVPAPPNSRFNAVSYAAGHFVATASSYGYGSPVVVHSTNGRDWTPGTLTVSPGQLQPYELNAVACSNGRFVAMGSAWFETNAVWVSTDGLQWTDQVYVPMLTRPRALIWANGQFVAAGGYGNLAVSSDGENWTPASRATTKNLRGVAHANGLFVAVGNAGTNLTSPDGIEWAGHPSPTLYNLHELTFGLGQFVAVGSHGTIATSPDGTNWTAQTSAAWPDLFDVVWANGLFVAVGGHANDDDDVFYHLLLSSTDGTNWVVRMSGYGFRLHGVTFGNGRFVAVGGPDAILTSTDGVDWTRLTPPSHYLKGVAYGNGVFVAVEESSTAYTSTDGTTWQTNSIPGAAGFDDLEFGAGVFVAVGNEGTIFRSENGTDWTPCRSPTDTNLRGVAYGGGTFVIVGNNDTILQSGPNPVIWFAAQPQSQVVRLGSNAVLSVSVRADNPVTFQWQRNGTNLPGATNATLVFANAQYSDSSYYAVEVSDGLHSQMSDTASVLVAATDPLDTWNKWSSSLVTSWLIDVICVDGLFVAVGDFGKILTSPDGVNWTKRDSGTNVTLYAITYGKGLFVAVGSSGTILASPDGVVWTRRVPIVTPYLNDVVYGNGMFVAMGQNIFLSSPDGLVWTNWTSVQGPGVLDGAYGNGRFVAVGGYSNVVYTSTDGLHWNQGATGVGGLGAVSWDGERFIAVGTGLIATSPDGLVWTKRVSGGNYSLYDVGQGPGRRVAVGSSILSSPDGNAWTLHYSGTGYFALRGVAYGHGTFVAVGIDGTSGNALFLQSDPLVPLPPVITNQPAPQRLLPGAGFTISVGACGAPLPSYQWRRNGVEIPGATNASYTVTNALVSDSGDYAAVVFNPVGSVTSLVARVGEVPRILVPPISQSVVRGGSVTFSVLAGGTPRLGFRWWADGRTARFDEQDEPLSFLTFTNVQANHTVRVGVTNAWSPIGNVSGYIHLTVLEDSDADGLPDEWEDSHGLNRNEPGDARLDADQDGASNLAEYEAGTDCQDPLSVLKLRLECGPVPTLSFTAVSNKTYTVQYTDALDGRGWSHLADVVAGATNRVEMLTDEAALGRTRFYRVVTPRQF